LRYVEETVNFCLCKYKDVRSAVVKNQDRLRPLKNLTFPATPMKRVDFYEVTGVRALSFRNLLVGETAGPDMSGQCGGGKTSPQISCRKDQPESLGTE